MLKSTESSPATSFVELPDASWATATITAHGYVILSHHGLRAIQCDCGANDKCIHEYQVTFPSATWSE